MMQKWHEEDGVISFTVTPDGTTGEQWHKRLKRKGICIKNGTENVLASNGFKITRNPAINVLILKGVLFDDEHRLTINVRDEAYYRRRLRAPNPDIACLIREKFTDDEIQEMGLWTILTMHQPIKDAIGQPFLLGAFSAEKSLNVVQDKHQKQFNRGIGFAFIR
jgi:hypothetical protein